MKNSTFKQKGKSYSFTFKGNTLLLKQELSKKHKVEVVNLYQTYKDKENSFVKTIGFLYEDGYNHNLIQESVIKRITTIEECQKKTIDFLNKLYS